MKAIHLAYNQSLTWCTKQVRLVEVSEQETNCPICIERVGQSRPWWGKKKEG